MRPSVPIGLKNSSSELAHARSQQMLEAFQRRLQLLLASEPLLQLLAALAELLELR